MNTDTMNLLAIDVGGNYMKSGLVNGQGQVLKVYDPVPTPQTKEPYMQALYDLIDSIEDEFAGIAMSHTGIIDTATGTLVNNGSMPFLAGTPFKSLLEERFDCPVEILNDGKAVVLAEHWQGALKGVDNGAVVVFGTGVACGMIINGAIYHGHRNMPGELSYILPNFVEAPLLDTIGVFEFVRPANELLGNEDLNDAHPIFEAIEAGTNQELIELFEDYCKVIANLIYNFNVTLDFERIAIGGGISNVPIFIEEIKRQYQYMFDNHPSDIFHSGLFQPVELVVSQGKSESNLIGAVKNYIDRQG